MNSDLKRLRRDLRGKLSALPLLSLSRILEKQDDSDLREQMALYRRQLEEVESQLLIEKANGYGIDIPPTADWWSEDVEHLSAKGRLMVGRLVQAEKRKNIEWWVKVISPFLSYVITILGLLLALLVVIGRKISESDGSGDPFFFPFPF